jgi:Ca-activated chloride channel family protein
LEAIAMNFVNGRVLWTIPVVVPGVIWFLWWSWRKRQALVRLFVSERLLPQLLEGFSPTRRKLKMGLQVAAVLFLMLALARPQWGFVWEEANTRGRDILVAIDTSRSMLAADMAPNRLTRAKLAALDLLRLAKNDRLGLIAFSGAAFLQCPLTLDDEAFRQNVDALDTSIIPQGGTAITEAIQTAITTFSTEEGDNHKVLIIFTDGEDHDGGAVLAAETADNHHIKIYTVGVGTPAGELVKIIDERGNSTFVKDEQGNVVKSRLNEDLLRQIATAAQGFYIPLREGNAMQVLYQRGMESMPTSELSSKLVRQLNEQFHWPLGIAIALLLIEALLPASPKKRTAAASSVATSGTTPAKAAVAALVLLMAVGSVSASPARAYRDYKKGNYKESRSEYERLLEKKPDDPKLSYNAGASAYREGAYDAAAKAFSNATKAPELDLQEKAYYNLGNSNYRLGGEQTAPDKKMAVWHEAVQNYESALKLNPQDADAQFNHDLVKKELEKLKQQQQQKNQDKNDNKDQNKDDKNQSDKNKEKQNKDKSQDKDNKDQNQQKEDQKDNQDSKSDEQKKQEQQKRDQEQQQKEQQQQQQQAQNDKKDGQQQDKPEAKNKDGQEQANQDQKSEQQREAEQEARAAQLAQMTPKQAQQMLDAQKTEEKALIYRQYDEKKKGRNRVFKDW